MTHGASHALNIRGQWGVVLTVKCCMITNDIHHGGARFFGVVDIGQPITEPRAKMRERRRRHTGHSSVAVCRTRNDAFKKSQDTAHFRVAIQCSHKVHFGCARICKADVYTRINKCLHE